MGKVYRAEGMEAQAVALVVAEVTARREAKVATESESAEMAAGWVVRAVVAETVATVG
jgi:hypothetical protein